MVRIAVPTSFKKRLLPLLVLVATCAVVLCDAHRVRADEAGDAGLPTTEPIGAANAFYLEAQAEDAAGAYAQAVLHYRAAVAMLPSFRYAPRATTRAALLAAHAEGEFIPYGRLEAVRRDPKSGDDPTAIDALARDAAAFPAGPTRSEAWMVCADAYLSRLHRRADAEATLRKVTGDLDADKLLRREAASILVGALLDDGNFDGARDVTVTMHDLVDSRLTRRIVVAARRRQLHRAAILDLLLFASVSVLTIGRGGARRLKEAAGTLRRSAAFVTVFALYLALAGSVLASTYEAGNARPFMVFGGTLIPIAFLARAWGVAGSSSPTARTLRGTLSASAVLSAAFLTLEAVNTLYLEGFNL